MSDSLNSMCEFCKVGYHAPFERFEKIATTAAGPAFLMKCKICATLWYETLHSVKQVSHSEALALYPEVSSEIAAI